MSAIICYNGWAFRPFHWNCERGNILLMSIDDLIAFYGSGPKAAEVLELKSASALYQWRRAKRIPHLRQIQIEHLTCGALKADADERTAA